MAPPQPPEPPPGQYLPQAKAKPTGRADPIHQQRSIAALFLAVLSLFGLLAVSNFQRGGYIIAFSLVAGAAGIWLASTAIIRARRSGTTRPRGSVTAIIICSIGVMLSTLLLAGLALFGKQASTYSQCISGANTLTAQQACRNQFIRTVEKSAG